MSVENYRMHELQIQNWNEKLFGFLGFLVIGLHLYRYNFHTVFP